MCWPPTTRWASRRIPLRIHPFCGWPTHVSVPAIATPCEPCPFTDCCRSVVSVPTPGGNHPAVREGEGPYAVPSPGGYPFSFHHTSYPPSFLLSSTFSPSPSLDPFLSALADTHSLDLLLSALPDIHSLHPLLSALAGTHPHWSFPDEELCGKPLLVAVSKDSTPNPFIFSDCQHTIFFLSPQPHANHG